MVLKTSIEFNSGLGIPFIHKGVEYFLGPDPCVDFAESQSGRVKITAKCTDTQPEVLEFLDGTEVIDFEDSCVLCADVRELILPKTVHFISANSFVNCYRLQKITPIESCYIDTAAFRLTGIEEISIEDATIGDSAFAYSSITRVHIKDSLVCLNVFQGCTNLETVIIEGHTSSRRRTQPSRSTHTQEIPHAMFKECRNLTSVSMSIEPQVLGSEAFQGCSSLAHLDLSGCHTLGFKALEGCYKLVDITLDNCVIMGQSALRNCGSLKRLNLHQCLKLPWQALSGCASLKFLNIENASAIDSEALEQCVSLTYLVSPKACKQMQELSKCTRIKLVFIRDDTHLYTIKALDKVLPSTAKFVVSKDVPHLSAIKDLYTKHGREFEIVDDLQKSIDKAYDSVQ